MRQSLFCHVLLIELTIDAKTILKKIEKPAVVYPKRPVSAYILFSSRKIRQELKDSLESDAKTKFRNAASKASKEWSEMSDEEKKVI